MTSIGTVTMDVEFNTSKMARDLGNSTGVAAKSAAANLTKTFEQNMAGFGKSAQKFGKDFTLGVSAPLAGIGAIAVKGFSGYESTLAKITGLTGVSREQTQAWSDDIRKVGTDFGIGAQDAADALYFITSSGIQGQEALDTLGVSAKASAVGLGETATVADLVTSALNAYAGTGLTAAQATDTLVAAVRDGKVEPDALAQSMGRVLPIASNLGVSFDQVSAAMASMSLTGTDADEAATQLRGILNALLKPSKQAEEALAGVGLSSAGLRKQIAEQGLLPTLETLVKTLGNDSAATAQVFDDTRALTGVMNILGKNAAQTKQIFDDTAHSTGALDDAFRETQETSEFKLNKSLASVKDSLIEIGAAAAPVAEKVATAGATAAGAFSKLPGPIQTVGVGLGTIAIAAGPAAFAVGKITSAFSVMVRFGSRLLDTSAAVQSIGKTSERAASQTAAGMSNMTNRLAQAGIAVGGLAVAFTILNQRMEDQAHLAGDLAKIGENKNSQAKTYQELQAQIARVNTELEGLAKANEDARFDPVDRAAYAAQADGLRQVGEQAAKFSGQALTISATTGDNIDKVTAWVVAQAGLGRTFKNSEEALTAYKAAISGAGDATGLAVPKAKDLQAQIQGLSTSFFGLTNAQDAYGKAVKGIATAQREEVDAGRRVADAQRSHADALRSVTDAAQRHEDSLRSLEDAQRAVAEAQDKLNTALNGPSTDDQLNVESAKLAVERAEERLKGKFDSPLDKKEAELSLRRAQNDLLRTQAEVAGRVAEAEQGVADAQGRVDSAQRDVEGTARAVADAQRSVEDSSRAVADAQVAQVEATDKVRDAQLQASGAAVALDTANANLLATLSTGSANIEPFVAHLEELKKKYPEVADSLQQYIDKFRELEALGKPGKSLGDATPSVSAPDNGAPDRSGNPSLQGRAYGGPVKARQTYGITERGAPEIYESQGRQYMIAPKDGKVVPLTASSGASGAPGLNIEHLEVKGGDAEETADAIRRKLRAAVYLGGR